MTDKLDCSMLNVSEKYPTAVIKCTNGREKKYEQKIFRSFQKNFVPILSWAEQSSHVMRITITYILLKSELKVFVCGMVRFS